MSTPQDDIRTRHYELQAARVKRLDLFVKSRLTEIIRMDAWLILKKECGGTIGFLRWIIHTDWVGARINLLFFWRLKVIREDPEDDYTWR